MNKFPILALALLLAGCASDEASFGVVASTPASITTWAISKKPVFGGAPPATDAEITELAQQHCRQFGRDARRAGADYFPMSRIVTFDCVAP